MFFGLKEKEPKASMLIAKAFFTTQYGFQRQCAEEGAVKVRMAEAKKTTFIEPIA